MSSRPDVVDPMSSRSDIAKREHRAPVYASKWFFPTCQYWKRLIQTLGAPGGATARLEESVAAYRAALIEIEVVEIEVVEIEVVEIEVVEIEVVSSTTRGSESPLVDYSRFSGSSSPRAVESIHSTSRISYYSAEFEIRGQVKPHPYASRKCPK